MLIVVNAERITVTGASRGRRLIRFSRQRGSAFSWGELRPPRPRPSGETRCGRPAHAEREAVVWQLADYIMRGPAGFNPHRRSAERRTRRLRYRVIEVN